MRDLSARPELVRHLIDIHHRRMRRAYRMRIVTTAVLLTMLLGVCAGAIYLASTFDTIALATELGAMVKAFREAAR